MSRWRMPCLSVSGQPAFEHLREAAQLLLDRLRLPDQDFQDAVFLAVGVDEVVAVDLGVRLELAVDAAVALFQAARVPGHVEVEQVPAVGLEVQALAGGVGGDQDADRVLPGSVVKARLISSRSAGGVGPW